MCEKVRVREGGVTALFPLRSICPVPSGTSYAWAQEQEETCVCVCLCVCDLLSWYFYYVKYPNFTLYNQSQHITIKNLYFPLFILIYCPFNLWKKNPPDFDGKVINAWKDEYTTPPYIFSSLLNAFTFTLLLLLHYSVLISHFLHATILSLSFHITAFFLLCMWCIATARPADEGQ